MKLFWVLSALGMINMLVLYIARMVSFWQFLGFSTAFDILGLVSSIWTKNE